MVALTPAEKQHRYRERQSALARTNPEATARALLEQAERYEQLPAEQRAELADQLADLAMSLLRRAQHLAMTAQKVRPPGWNPFPAATPAKPTEQQMLNDLHPMQREIVEDVMVQHPGLTVAEAIEACRAGGM